jgi:hypothetical protein
MQVSPGASVAQDAAFAPPATAISIKPTTGKNSVPAAAFRSVFNLLIFVTSKPKFCLFL